MRLLSASLTSPRGWRWLAAALLICATGLAQAQTQAPPDDSGAAGDPPSRVARLSYRTGDVGLLPAGEKNWGDASLNRPLTTGDRLSTGEGARAELELGGGTVRIADDSDFGFLTLNDQLTQVELTQGTLNLAVRNLDEGQSYEVDTPTVALVVTEPGTYRVDISEDGKSTRITDFNGRATVYGEGGAQRLVASGRTYEFADSSLNEVMISDISGSDDFDAWCSSRDQRYQQQGASDQYVSDDMVGTQDLDQYGSWQPDSDYGQVWYPASVGVDWAPYRTGHWAYVGPWGWTWVDDAPWGFAPYHYGRWAFIRGRWGWVPGPVAVRPVYAPALVAFVGGPGLNVSIGIGGGGPVGWFPLGPGEVYNPWYHVSRGYYTNVNVTNIYVRNDRNVVINNINNHYNYFASGRPMPDQRFMNREAPRAFTAMQAQDFAAARSVQRNMVAADPQHFAAAPVMARGLGLQPSQASFAPPRTASARSLPAGGFQREVVARNAPVAAFAARPNPTPGTPRGPAPSPTQVRVLGSTPSGNRAAMPAAAAAPAMRAPMSQGSPAAGGRPDELPSARFARPQGGEERAYQGNRQQPANNQPRPGVSYIPSAEEDRAARMQPQPGTLPAEQHFERAQPAPQENAQRFNQPRQEPQAPRYEAQPQQRNQPQGGYQGPQGGYQGPQRSYEQPHVEQAPHPQGNNGQQGRPQGNHDEHHPPPRKDDQHN